MIVNIADGSRQQLERVEPHITKETLWIFNTIDGNTKD